MTDLETTPILEIRTYTVGMGCRVRCCVWLGGECVFSSDKTTPTFAQCFSRIGFDIYGKYPLPPTRRGKFFLDGDRWKILQKRGAQ